MRAGFVWRLKSLYIAGTISHPGPCSPIDPRLCCMHEWPAPADSTTSLLWCFHVTYGIIISSIMLNFYHRQQDTAAATVVAVHNF